MLKSSLKKFISNKQTLHDKTLGAANGGIISEVYLDFFENEEINKGMCSCVCINDERCCGCFVQ